MPDALEFLGVHEREALLRSTSRMSNCRPFVSIRSLLKSLFPRSKSLKFVERPERGEPFLSRFEPFLESFRCAGYLPGVQAACSCV